MPIAGTGSSVATLLSAMLSLVLVLLLAWLLLRWMGKRMPLQSGSTGRHIRVLDRVIFAQDKYLVLVKVAEKTLLVGFSGNSVENLSEIDDPDDTLLEPPPQNDNKFSSLLGEYMGRGIFRSKKEESD